MHAMPSKMPAAELVQALVPVNQNFLRLDVAVSFSHLQASHADHS
jgi:hypothetical protein